MTSLPTTPARRREILGFSQAVKGNIDASFPPFCSGITIYKQYTQQRNRGF